MRGGTQMIYQQQSSPQIAKGPTGIGAVPVGWGGQLQQPGPGMVTPGYKPMGQQALGTREAMPLQGLRAPSVLQGRSDAGMTSYAPAHSRGERPVMGHVDSRAAGLSGGEVRGALAHRGFGGLEVPSISTSTSQGAFAAPTLGSANISLGDRAKATATAMAGAPNAWPHSPEPRTRAPWPGLQSAQPTSNQARSSAAGPTREGGASLYGIAPGNDTVSWAGGVTVQVETQGSARHRTGAANGGSGSFAIPPGDVGNEVKALQVVRQSSRPYRCHEQSTGTSVVAAPAGQTLPGPPRQVAPAEMGGSETMQANGASGRPPPPVILYSARSNNPGRPGQPVPYYSAGTEQTAKGRSPARLRPSAQTLVNRSPTRMRPPAQSTMLNQQLPVRSPYAPAHGMLVPDNAAPEAYSPPAGGLAAGPYPGSANFPARILQSGSTTAPPQLPAAPLHLTMEAQDSAQNGDDDMENVLPLQNAQYQPWAAVEEPANLAVGELTAEEKIAYGDMKFIEHIGSGEFGQVFRGFYSNQEVAIKQLYWDNNVAPEVIIEDLTREIESFRHLRHKRLVKFIGACLEIPHLCLVTEYMPGGSLHYLLHVRKTKLPPLHCINMCLQLADGVVYLHSQNPVVVHRDLKSLNVVLDMNLNIKLCDFGLTESMERTHITKKNNGGSPRYMAPELFDNKSKITEKVDIWSMGCIFTEIFGGPLPYEGINTLADLTREMLVRRRMPHIPENVPGAIQSINRSCYNFDFRLRPAAKQIFDQLRDVKKRLRGQGVI